MVYFVCSKRFDLLDHYINTTQGDLYGSIGHNE